MTKLKRRIRIGFFGALVTMLTVAAVTLRSTFMYMELGDARQRSVERTSQIQALLSTLKDAETGQRGYLLTGNEAYLKPYREALGDVDAQLARLSDSLGDDRQQRASLALLGPRVKEKLSELEETVALRQKGEEAAALAVVNSGRGIKAMDEMRAILEAMSEREMRRLDVADQAARRGGIWAMVAIATGTALTCVMTVVNLVVISHDLAGRARAESQLLQAQHELEDRVAERTAELVAANDEISAGHRPGIARAAAHGRTGSRQPRAGSLQLLGLARSARPLRAIDGFSQALLDDCMEGLDDRGRDYLQRVRKATQRMAELIDALLTLARVTRAQVNHDEIDLSQIARSIASDLNDSDESRLVDFAITDEIKAEGDGDLMRVALDNLLGNAWKFTGKKEQARIEFGVLPGGDRPTYFVRDNGAGFDMTYVDRLFGAFQRLHGNDEFTGTGIGLATVHRIVHRHGGKIWAEGKPGEGATFYFCL